MEETLKVAISVIEMKQNDIAVTIAKKYMDVDLSLSIPDVEPLKTQWRELNSARMFLASILKGGDELNFL